MMTQMLDLTDLISPTANMSRLDVATSATMHRLRAETPAGMASKAAGLGWRCRPGIPKHMGLLGQVARA